MKIYRNRLFRFLYSRLVKINDTPQRIALGLGIGVFLGIIPGTGPIAALALAFVLRVNRAASLLGSLVTNTWLSIVTALLSIKVGSSILKTDWQGVYKDWGVFLKDFHWVNLSKLPILKLILPVILGYFVVAFCLGVMVYLVTLIIFTYIRYKQRLPL